jgi:hypothetical protein
MQVGDSKMKRKSLFLPIQLKTKNLAFTLPELLIAGIAGALMVSAAATVFISHTNSSMRLEAINRLQGNWKRIQFLIEQDISESFGVATNTAATGCPTGTSMLTLEGPRDDPGASPINPISYYLSASTLRRCGPSIDQNGELDLGTPVDSVVIENVSSFQPDITNPRSPSFSLTLQDPSGVSYSNSSRESGGFSRARSVVGARPAPP